MKSSFVIFLSILTLSLKLHAQTTDLLPVNYPSKIMYSIQVKPNGEISQIGDWNRASVSTSNEGLKTTIYELQGPSKNTYAVEVDQNKAGNVETVIAYDQITDKNGQKSNEVRITSYLSSPNNREVRSSTICWDHKTCMTIDQGFCDRIKRTLGATSNKDLKDDIKSCQKISEAFSAAAHGDKNHADTAEFKALRAENAIDVKKWTSSKSFSNYAKGPGDRVLDFVIGKDYSFLPFDGGMADQKKIFESLSACDYFSEVHAFDETRKSSSGSRSQRTGTSL